MQKKTKNINIFQTYQKLKTTFFTNDGIYELKKASAAAEISLEAVTFFLIVHASIREKRCLQFSIVLALQN